MGEMLEPLFQLVRYSWPSLCGLFFVIWIVGDHSLRIVEKQVWGEAFSHWGDLAWLWIVAITFSYTAWEKEMNRE